MQTLAPTAADDLNRARRLAQAYATTLRSQFGDRVKRLILFGSTARGDWRPDSDVDVAVLLDRVDIDDSLACSQLAYTMGLMETGLLLQPTVMTWQRFELLRQRERAFAIAVEREGIEL